MWSLEKENSRSSLLKFSHLRPLAGRQTGHDHRLLLYSCRLCVISHQNSLNPSPRRRREEKKTQKKQEICVLRCVCDSSPSPGLHATPAAWSRPGMGNEGASFMTRSRHELNESLFFFSNFSLVIFPFASYLLPPPVLPPSRLLF